MTQEELARHILSRYDADSDHSFEGDSTVTVFLRRDNRKWFAATKNIGRRYLGIEGGGRVDILNVKLEPRVITALRTREGFLPAWRMNQNSWITVLLDGTVPDEEIYAFVDKSYEIAGTKGRKKPAAKRR